MRHHQYNPKFRFTVDPIEFDKYTDPEILRYVLGATMYMPGTKDFLDAILTRKYPGLTTMVMCFEDACPEEDVPAAEDNCIEILTALADKERAGEILYGDIPLIIFRVRDLAQFKRFSARLTPRLVRFITAFNFPKFNAGNGEEYFYHLKQLNEQFREVIYGMPILEDRTIAFKESRMTELMNVRRILMNYRDLVLNVRVGGTDFSSCFGVRRGMNYTIYDIMPVRDCLADILNVFTRDNDFTVSGPVWEYFRVNKSLKFSELPAHVDQSLFRHEPVINAEVDGLLRELLLDRANGFVGKTIIHPTHLPYVNGMLAVTREVYEDARQILSTGGGVIKSRTGNKMNEIGPHKSWAQRILMRARAYGVISSEADYIRLFTGGQEE